MTPRIRTAVIAAALVATGAGMAWAQYPIMDMIADKVVAKYQNATCEQLWESRGKHSPEEQRAVTFLKEDPAMRQAFFNRIAGPVVNKMFTCGMIP